MELGRMEGNIYLCKKKKVMGIYSLELIDNPKIKTKGVNLESCKVNICMQIIEWNDDGEAILEFLPEKSKRTVTGLEMYRNVGYNDTTELSNINDLYDGGICPKCKYAIGHRTDEVLNFTYLPKGKKIIIGVSKRAKKVENEFSRLFPHLQIYHQEFIKFFTNEEHELFDVREVLYKGKISDYIELIPKKVIKNCSHKGAEYTKHKFLKNWQCTECGRKELHFWTKQYGWENDFVNPSDINNLPNIFFFDTGLHISLCVRSDRWIEISKNKKITTNPVIVLDKEYVEYPNYFEEPEKFEW